jgi:hypothetical protein
MKVSTSLMAKVFLTSAISLFAAKAIAQVAYTAWPNSTTVVNVTTTGTFGGNMSGLFYENSNIWAVQNAPSRLFKLIPNATGSSDVKKDTTNGWSAGKTLRYPNGSGEPDAEGVTKAELTSPLIYVATERDGSGSSKLSVLEYNTTGTATIINATKEWNLTTSLPSVAANSGLEAIAWVPDSYLTANNFKNDAGAIYTPANYPLKVSGGLFFVGLEGNGQIYAYVLNSNSTYTKVATIASGNTQIMDLSFDQDNNTLWAYCDNNCTNKSNLLSIDSTGKFVIRKAYNAAPGLPTGMNNEGIAMKPNTECVSSTKDFYWADDSETSGIAIRRGKIPCTY